MARELTMVRQRRGNDCGPSALATVVAYHGFTTDNGVIFNAVALNRRGTDLLTISRAAERLGFRTQGIKGSYDTIPELILPVIAHVRRRLGGGHFVVVHRWTCSHVVLADPAAGIRKVSKRTFCRRWTGYLLAILPAPIPPEIQSQLLLSGSCRWVIKDQEARFPYWETGL